MNTDAPLSIPLRAWVVGLCAIALLGGMYLLSHKPSQSAGIVKACANASNREACYEEVVPKLYPEHSLPEVFAVIREIRQADRSYQFCHVLAHKLGERVVAEDPSRWLDALPQNPPDGICSNGFIHGVVAGRFRAEVLSPQQIEALIPDFSRACEPRSNWSPSDLDRNICHHGLGHLYDFITDADIPAALTLCKRTIPAAHERTCIEGVFMQIYQPLEPDDFALIERMKVKPTPDTVRSYCKHYSYNPDYEGACLRESWPYFAEGIKDGSAVQSFCSGQPDAERTQYCYESTASLVGRMSLDDPARALAACARFPTDRQTLCYGYAAETIIQEDRNDVVPSVALCVAAPANAQAGCLEHLLSHSEFLFGANQQQFNAFCQALPQAIGGQCMQRMSAYYNS